MQDNNQIADKTKRNLLLGGAALSATLAAGNSFAGASEHAHHHMKNKYSDVIEATTHCVKSGDACLAHCIELVKMNDTSIAGCLASVTDMLPMCTAISKLAANQSDFTVDLAKICISVCEACEKECRKHEKKHEACRNCAESCAACIKECKKIVA